MEADGRAVTVFVSPRAFVRVCAHAGSDLENEVGGALLGQWRIDPEAGREYVVVDATLRARHTRFGSSFLTFTTESLVALHEEKDARYPEKDLVGWYHTHPGMGVFLSGHDLWLHRHFFPEAWQVALVVEPHSASGGFFVRGTDGSLDAHKYVGFYELMRAGSAGVVHWGNLAPDASEEEGGQAS
jgi:proteasome lid subunit RPN8/RPN11